MSTQTRLMRTYRVTLTNSETVVGQADVNLSFTVDAAGNPIDDQGREITDLKAYVELQGRLRRLAGRKQVPVTHAELDACDWQVKVVRARLVKIETDETGRPVRSQKKG
jgi:hypothetical protein